MRRWFLSVVVAGSVTVLTGCSSGGSLGSVTSEDAGSGAGEASPSAIATDDVSSDFSYRVDDSKDPTHAHVEAYRNSESGAPLAQLESAFAKLKREHLAYRGTPPRLTMHVESATASEVLVAACEHPAKTGSWAEYDTRTGKPVPTSPGTELFFPNELIVRVTLNNANGESIISAITPKTGVVCNK